MASVVVVDDSHVAHVIPTRRGGPTTDHRAVGGLSVAAHSMGTNYVFGRKNGWLTA